MNTLSNRWYKLLGFPGAGPMLGLVLASLVGTAYLGQKVPQAVASLAQAYQGPGDFGAALRALASLFIATYILRSGYQVLLNYYLRRLLQHLRVNCFQRWLLAYDLKRAGEGHEDLFPQGEVIARLMNDTQALRDLLTSGAFGIFIDLFFVLSCFAGFMQLNARAGLVLGGAEIAACALLFWGSKNMRDIFQKVRHARGQVSGQTANVVGGLSESWFGQHYNYASKSGEKVFSSFMRTQLTANNWDTSYYSIAESLYPIFLAVMALAFPFVNILQAATAFALVDLIQRSIGPIKEMASKIANLQRALTGIQKIEEFLGELARAPRAALEASEAPVARLESLSVHVGRFAYRARGGRESGFVLGPLSFEARPGMLVGIAGQSGHGKSTLLKLLSGALLPEDGEVALKFADGSGAHFHEGAANSEWELMEYRRHVGLVSQDSHVFSESLGFNLSLNSSPSAGQKVGLEDFFESMRARIPYLGQWGIQLADKLDVRALSLGQRQLICALRACYLKKSVVLFDEISSALDSRLEEALRKTVLLAQAQAVAVIVAHRLETIIRADLILVMHQGRVVHRGTHQELLAGSDLYRQFVAEIS